MLIDSTDLFQLQQTISREGNSSDEKSQKIVLTLPISFRSACCWLSISNGESDQEGHPFD